MSEKIVSSTAINRKSRANGHQQQGFSLLAMVMVLLLLGLLLLGIMNRQIITAARFSAQEGLYLQEYNRAASGLQWGVAQHWPPATERWQCQQQSSFIACLKAATEEKVLLLRSESVPQQGSRSVRLYRRMQTPETPWLQHMQLQPSLQGWLDFCPIRQEAVCEE